MYRKTWRVHKFTAHPEFFDYCRVLKKSECPFSPVAQAVFYALSIKDDLKKFLKDSRLNIDNNPAERLN
ncbi:MAG: transposase [Victivallales bacterium]